MLQGVSVRHGGFPMAIGVLPPKIIEDRQRSGLVGGGRQVTDRDRREYQKYEGSTPDGPNFQDPASRPIRWTECPIDIPSKRPCREDVHEG